MSSEGLRTKLFRLLLTLLWIGVVARLGYVQLFRCGHYRALARRLHWTKVALVPQRGLILDRQGRPLTLNRSCCSIRILPQYARDKDTLADILARFDLGDRDAIRRQLDESDRLFWFRRKFDCADPESLRNVLVRRQFHNCVLIDDDLHRAYPYGEMCASVLGCVGDEAGLAGIEFEYDSVLRGRPDSVLLQKDAIGYSYPDPRYPTRAATPGADIWLTLDVEVQAIAYAALRAAVSGYQALAGSAVVLDSRTGEVLALVDYPSYDPRMFGDFPASRRKSGAVGDQFEPGSVFKLVTCIAALESPNAETLTGRLYDVSADYLPFGKWKIRDTHRNGVLTFDSVFVQSSNMGCAIMSRQIDPERFYQTALALGFANPTVMGLPNEGRGRLLRPARLQGVEFATISFGQGGVMVTLMQLAAAYMCVANEGEYVRPYIIREVRQGDRIVARYGPARLRRAFRIETARRVKDILQRAVCNGTGRLAQISGVEVCGKTGTAQKIENGKHSATRSRMTFVGFFPKDKPRYVMAVLLDEPQRVRFAGAVACPVFRDIGERLLALERVRRSGDSIEVLLADGMP